MDNAEAWSVNECSLSFNAPLLWMASFLEDKGASEKIIPPVFESRIWGDANQDKQLKLNDAVLIMQSISNADRYGVDGTEKTHITKQGQYWGDVYEHNNGVITPQDALQIQKYLIKEIPDLTPAEKKVSEK